MKTLLTTGAIITLCIAMACGSSKKNTTAKAPETAPAASSTPSPVVPLLEPKRAIAADVITPGEAQLTAIQARFKDVTMQTLTEGHALYVGTCTNCHDAKSIGKRSEEQWAHIIEAMSEKAKLTTAQRDAVFKYVLAVKSTQPKGQN